MSQLFKIFYKWLFLEIYASTKSTCNYAQWNHDTIMRLDKLVTNFDNSYPFSPFSDAYEWLPRIKDNAKLETIG